MMSFFSLFAGCDIPDVKLDYKADPDIVIINIGTGDRAAIARMIRIADSCHPAVIGLDAWFQQAKDGDQDSLLEAAIQQSGKVILTMGLNEYGQAVHSIDRFRKYAKGEGPALTIKKTGLADRFIPIQTISGKEYEHFALQLLKKWKPGIQFNYKVDEKIKIEFRRDLDRIPNIQGSDWKASDLDLLIRDKVVLMGFTGPGNEDKHFTPLRFTGKFKDQGPDTYGVVIIANEIRTLLCKATLKE